MKSSNESATNQFYEAVGRVNGWNFSRLKVSSEGVAWNYYDEVARRCGTADLLLDVGTGGGEGLLTIAGSALLLIGIDRSAGMIETAKRNAQSANAANVRFFQMDSEHLLFPDGLFHVAACRHAPFCAGEIARLLVSGGVFITQQVGESDKRNLAQAFGRGQHTDADGTLKNKYITELQEAGFSDIQSFEYDAVEYYATYEDLLFLLMHTPIIPDFGRDEHDFSVLRSFIDANQTEKGIQTNASRFMLIATK
ncbi:class I SAM-dependent methyltransferase [Paenibacillus piri]|nr:class I SAM-dependent methyltransferase [Paenibacillus piri]